MHALLQPQPIANQGKLPALQPQDAIPAELSDVRAQHDEQELQKCTAQVHGGRCLMP